MNCNTAQVRLQRALDDASAPDTATRDHLATCAACAAFERQLKRLHQNLAATRGETERSPPAHATARMAAAAWQATTRRTPVGFQRVGRRQARTLTALAAGILLAVGLGRQALHRHASPRSLALPSPAVDAVATAGRLFDACTRSIWQALLHPEVRLETEMLWLRDDLVSAGRNLLDAAGPDLFRVSSPTAPNGG